MIKLSYMRLLALMFFVLTAGIYTSCKKNDTASNDGRTQLITFGPTGARVGDTIRFQGLNLDKVTAIQFTGTNATVNQSNFISQSSELIKVLVPATVERGYVTLKSSTGDVVSKTMFDINVKSGASITSITKNARPGDNVTITGNYLNFAKRVTFNSNKQVISFVSQSQNQLVVKVPADAQTGQLVVTFGGTDTTDVRTTDTLKVALPVATSFSPTPVKHNTNLTITGTDLDLAKKVYLPGVSKAITSFVSQSATQLVVNVDSTTTNGKVVLEAASGVQTTSSASVAVALPTITSMAPSPVAEGSNLTITGTNLDLVSGVKFTGVNTTVTSFVSQSPTQLVVTVPMGTKIGNVTLNVLKSSLKVTSTATLYIVGQAVPPIIIYDDAVTSAWNGWIGGGWGGTADRNNTSPVRDGSKSIKIDYAPGYGSPFQLGGANIPLAGYTSIKFSVYGAPGSGGKTINFQLNNAGGPKYSFQVVEGQWTDYTVSIANDLGNLANLTEIWFQDAGGAGGFTIYVDAIGIY